MAMSSELDQSTWNSEADKLLKFRDEIVDNLDKEDLSLKRLVIERRIKKAAKDYLHDESAFAKGRIDLVSERYLEAISMDYDELKTAGVAYKAESEITDVLEADQDIEGEKDEKDESPERQDTTMDHLISNELNNDRSSNIVSHLRKENRLVSSARKNTELVKTMLSESESAIGNTRKRHLTDQDDNWGPIVPKRGDHEHHHRYPQVTNQFSDHPETLENLNSQASIYNHHNGIIGEGNNVVPLSQNQWAFNSTQSSLPFQQFPSLPKKTSTSGIKKTRSGTLSPRNPRASSPPQQESRGKVPKALRKMEHIARKHSL
ncbi:LAFA_0E19614g1_1 [Lachancea sp. 'fantastica']|nr:LAFA_0E19614g1_1 [Lachancea sp. 'fantastica']